MRTICLTLPETPERTERAKAHFKERGIEVEWYWGFHGGLCGLTNRHTLKHFMPGDDHPWVDDKAVGIWMSMIGLLSACLLLPEEYFLLLEVDAEFPENWRERFELAMYQVPKGFDLLYIGNGSTLGGHREPIAPGSTVYKVEKCTCTHAYVVAKKSIPTILLHLRHFWTAVDLALQNDCFHYLKVFAVLPRIVEQHGWTMPE